MFQIQPSAKNNRICFNIVPGAFVASTGSTQELINQNNFFSNRTSRGDNIKMIDFLLASKLTITSTTPGNIAVSRSVAAPSFPNTVVGVVRVTLNGSVAGTTAAKDVAVSFAGTTLISTNFLNTETGKFNYQITIRATQTGFMYAVTGDKLGVFVAAQGEVSGLDFATVAYELNLSAWVGAASSNVQITNFQSRYESII